MKYMGTRADSPSSDAEDGPWKTAGETIILEKGLQRYAMKNAFHVMIIPTLGCPSRCSYCWSSEEGSPVMTIDTVREIVAWLKDFRNERVTFTFHGGEPLLAGADFYRQALPLLSEGLEPPEAGVCPPDQSLEAYAGTGRDPCRIPCPHRFQHRRAPGIERPAEI